MYLHEKKKGGGSKTASVNTTAGQWFGNFLDDLVSKWIYLKCFDCMILGLILREIQQIPFELETFQNFLTKWCIKKLTFLEK